MNKIISIKKFLFVILLLIVSCSYVQKETISPEIYENITPQASFRLIQQNKNNADFVIIDVRTPEEIENGFIESAIFLDFKQDGFAKKISKLDKSKIYLVYCKGGLRSHKATDIMAKMGFQYLYNMDGGFDEWKKVQLPYIKN